MNTCYNPFTLIGKSILVTGASSGIGKAIAVQCSKMGAVIIATARNEERLKATFDELQGEGHTLLLGDLTSDDDLNRIVGELPKLDGVVLCAGVGSTLLLPFATTEKAQKVFDVNFFSQLELMRMLLKKKLLKKESSIVAISSIGGVTRFSIGNGVYGAAKAALKSIMKTAANELRPKSIRVNCICPGMVETPLIQNGTLSDDMKDADRLKYYGNRYGRPEEIAYGAIYLLSDASSWVTGTSLIIDGGVS